MTELSTEEPDLSATQGIRARSVGFWTDLVSGPVERCVSCLGIPRWCSRPSSSRSSSSPSTWARCRTSPSPAPRPGSTSRPSSSRWRSSSPSPESPRGSLVTDIQSGYFDRLLVTPVNRLALLLGLMVADAFLVVLLSLPVVLMGFLVGVRFEAGPMGVLAFIGLGTLWGLMFAGFPYAIGLRTGNPSAVNLSFMLFFPFAFLTTSFVPQENLTGWLGTIADYNPVTYLLEGAAVPPARGMGVARSHAGVGGHDGRGRGRTDPRVRRPARSCPTRVTMRP